MAGIHGLIYLGYASAASFGVSQRKENTTRIAPSILRVGALARGGDGAPRRP